MAGSQEIGRRWYQYNLRSLFVLTAIVAIGCGWYAFEKNQAAKRRVVIWEFMKLGKEVRYYDANAPDTFGEPPKWFSWMRRLHGDAYLGHAVHIDLSENHWSYHAGIFYHSSLQTGNIDGDDSLVNIGRLTSLESLALRDTPVTDAGLVHLKNLKNLRRLDLGGTRVTENGVETLQETLRNCEIIH